MASLSILTFAVLALAIGGLAAVLWEILAKDPRSLVEMAVDSRRFAEAPLAGEAAPRARRAMDGNRVAANQNQSRIAA